MKIQLVLFIIGFVIMSLLPIAMKRGNGSSDVMILLMLAVNFLAFFYQDRFRRNNKNYLAQGLYLILCLMCFVFCALSLVYGSRGMETFLAMVGGFWFFGDGVKNILLNLTRRPVDGEYLGISAHPYKENTFVPWFYYHMGDKVYRGCPKGSWQRGEDFPTPGEAWKVYVSPLSPLDCSLAKTKFSFRDICVVLVGISLMLRSI